MTNIIVLVVLYECGIWSFILREEQRLWVSKRRLLKRMFGSKGQEVRGGRREIHNEKLNNMFSSPNTIQAIKWKVEMGGASSTRRRDEDGIRRQLERCHVVKSKAMPVTDRGGP
jgi:hypothetical protein